MTRRNRIEWDGDKDRDRDELSEKNCCSCLVIVAAKLYEDCYRDCWSYIVRAECYS